MVILGSQQGMASALDDFQNATAMFEKEKYSQAIELFKIAEKRV